jgi:hypothetical protein
VRIKSDTWLAIITGILAAKFVPGVFGYVLCGFAFMYVAVQLFPAQAKTRCEGCKQLVPSHKTEFVEHLNLCPKCAEVEKRDILNP